MITNDAANATTAIALPSVLRLRLVTGFLVLCGLFVFWAGLQWDLAAHAMLARDRTFTPPHIAILSGITITGLAALMGVLVESSWAKRYQEVRNQGIGFVGGFSSALGIYIAGFGATCGAIGFPLDNFWHALNGIDTSLWAPFHVMFIGGAMFSAFGVFLLLVSTGYQFSRQHRKGLTILCFLGAFGALGVIMNILMLMINAALIVGTIHLPFMSLNLFPVMIATLPIIPLFAVQKIFSWRWTLTCAICASLVLSIIISLFGVPVLMNWQLHTYHLVVPKAFLARASGQTFQAVQEILFLVVFLGMSLVVDTLIARGQKKKRSPLASSIAVIPFVLLIGSFGLFQLFILASMKGGLASDGETPFTPSVAAAILPILLAIPGGLVGGWVGRHFGISLQKESEV